MTENKILPPEIKKDESDDGFYESLESSGTRRSRLLGQGPQWRTPFLPDGKGVAGARRAAPADIALHDPLMSLKRPKICVRSCHITGAMVEPLLCCLQSPVLGCLFCDAVVRRQ